MNISKSSKIYIAGHRGMVGSAIWRALDRQGYTNIIGKTSNELDLSKQLEVQNFFDEEKPEFVIDAAAKVGGILANDTYPYEFLMNNMLIQNNLIKSSHESGVKKFIFLGSSCIYPKLSEQPIKEEYLLTGELEPTNEWYAIAKISGVKLCEAIRKQYGKDFVSLMPTNLYGPFDNFDLETSHVLPALLRKFHEAKKNNQTEVILWGSGMPMREFLHVDDLASAVLFTLENRLKDSLYNIGSGIDISIRELAEIIQREISYDGNIVWDTKKPDGTPRKLMDSSKMRSLGWKPKYSLQAGIKNTHEWFLKNENSLRIVKL
jgi:GDP-L-fucose synthase